MFVVIANCEPKIAGALCRTVIFDQTTFYAIHGLYDLTRSMGLFQSIERYIGSRATDTLREVRATRRYLADGLPFRGEEQRPKDALSDADLRRHREILTSDFIAHIINGYRSLFAAKRDDSSKGTKRGQVDTMVVAERLQNTIALRETVEKRGLNRHKGYRSMPQ